MGHKSLPTSRVTPRAPHRCRSALPKVAEVRGQWRRAFLPLFSLIHAPSQPRGLLGRAARCTAASPRGCWLLDPLPIWPDPLPTWPDLGQPAPASSLRSFLHILFFPFVSFFELGVPWHLWPWLPVPVVDPGPLAGSSPSPTGSSPSHTPVPQVQQALLHAQAAEGLKQ